LVILGLAFLQVNVDLVAGLLVPGCRLVASSAVLFKRKVVLVLLLVTMGALLDI